MLVAHEARESCRVDIVDTDRGSERVSGFILESTRGAVILGPVFDREMSRVDLADAAAADGAGEAGAVLNDVGVAVFVRRVHRLGVELVRAFETHAAIVARRQAAESVGHVHHRQRAVAGHALAVGQARVDILDDIEKRFRLGMA